MFFISFKKPFFLEVFKFFVIVILPFHTFQIQKDLMEVE